MVQQRKSVEIGRENLWSTYLSLVSQGHALDAYEFMKRWLEWAKVSACNDLDAQCGLF